MPAYKAARISGAVCQHTRQFTAGDDVEAGAQARKQVQDGEAGVGLHRVANKMWVFRQRLIVGTVGVFERGA
jgi:hypothetical protein